MSLRLTLLAALGLLSACSCSEEPDTRGLVTSGPPLRLLARGPDAVIEQPGILAPQGDLPGTMTWGAYEGTGWSSKEHRLEDGQPYLETNQPVAKLILPVVEAVDRDIELYLWTAQTHGTEPAPVTLTLNGVPLGSMPLGVTPSPDALRVHAPAPAWVRGENLLEIATPEARTADGPRWDTLALAGVAYGPELRVELDLAHGRATLKPRTGLRTSLWQRGPAELRVAGRCAGSGTLSLLVSDMDLLSGARSAPSASADLAVHAGRVEGTLPLAPRAGTVRVLELEWRSPGGAELVLEGLDVHEVEGRAWPPIVLVSIDTFAARHLSLYGYGRATSPVLDALQQEAVVFERCNANAPWTMPSYLSVMTGLYPKAHLNALEVQPGAELNNWDWYQIAPNRWTLAEALRARGYRTAGFIDTLWLTPQFGVAQGFDHYDGEAALRPFQESTAGIQLIVEERVPPWLTGGPAGVPPFLFVHALDAHGPYIPEAPFGGTFSDSLPADLHQVPAGAVHQSFRGMPDWMARTLLLDESVPLPPEVPLEEVVARYDETLLKVDSYLGRLFELLKRDGLYDDAVIVVTGDHGEHFGPDVYGHGVMHGDVLQVPLVLKLPHGEFGGTRFAAPVQLVDLYPTLLELAGVTVDPRALHGQSLLPRLRGADGPERRYSEAGWVELYSLTEGRWKIVEERPASESSTQSVLTHPRVPREWLAQHFPELLERPLSKTMLEAFEARPGFEERLRELRSLVAGPYYSLFDLEADPREEHDLAAERAEVLARMKALLEVEKARSLEARLRANPDGARRALGDAQLQQLEALGYGGH